jgi:hypothetical protein
MVQVKKIHPVLRPFGLPKDIEPTRENIKSWIINSKPSIFKVYSPAIIAGDALSIIGIIAWIAGYKKDSKSTKWTGRISLLAGILIALTGGIKNGTLSAIFNRTKKEVEDAFRDRASSSEQDNRSTLQKSN